MQVSEKEREQQNERVLKDIATIVAEKCVDPTTNRPFPVTSIERAIKSVHYSIHPTRTPKQQVNSLSAFLFIVLFIALLIILFDNQK